MVDGIYDAMMGGKKTKKKKEENNSRIQKTKPTTLALTVMSYIDHFKPTSIQEIVRETKVSEELVKKYIKELYEAGYIDKNLDSFSAF